VSDLVGHSPWRYEPSRPEAALHLTGWCFAAVWVAGGLTRAVPFGWGSILGFGWLAILASGIVIASRRVGGSWASFIANTARNNKVRGYFIEPWKVARSWSVLRGSDASG
jgi:hypothetical protein